MIKVIDCNTPIYVNKIFCINLEKDIERKKDMIERLDKFNLTDKVEFVKGVYNKLKPTIGCRNSHRNIIKRAYQEKINNIMILEDDCEFNEFPFKINCSIPNNWHMIYPGWLDVDLKSFKYSENLVKLKSGRNTHCYILNIKSYPYILRMINSNEHVDMFYSNIIQNSMNCYGLYPLKAFQSLYKSNISGEINKNINNKMIKKSNIVFNKQKPKKESNEWYGHYKRFMEKCNNNYDLDIKILTNLLF
jgi:hypothetical protein